MTRARSAIRAYVLDAKWMQVLVPLVILTLYLVTFSYFLSWLLPEYRSNVNACFATRAWKYVLLLAAAFYLAFFALFKIVNGNKLTFDNSTRNPVWAMSS